MVRMTRLRTALLATLLVAGTAAACGESTAPATATATRHMITNHGHKLAFYVTPGHLPAIVLDSGGGQDASYWKNLVPTLARNTGSEIITYDRAGLDRKSVV